MQKDKLVYKETDKVKSCISSSYHYLFDKKNGEFWRWGETTKDDPDYSPVSAEILDLEVTTSCKGINGTICPFCYKANTPSGKNMSFDTFKTIFHNMTRNLTQIAFGADSQAISNPDLFKMMEYCRDNSYQEIIPNITVAQISDKTADILSKVCGAVAVSRYSDKDVCYDSVEKLTKNGMDQVNIHQMISSETYSQALNTVYDRETDSRLEKLNAIVFLSLKQRGRGINHTPLSQEQFNLLIRNSLENNVTVGFDSCSAPKFMKLISEDEKYKKNYEAFNTMSEPCESSLFSAYINVDGHFYPCSFCEGIGEWKTGIDCTKESMNFIDDCWDHPRVKEFRTNLINNSDERGIRCCPVFNV